MDTQQVPCDWCGKVQKPEEMEETESFGYSGLVCSDMQQCMDRAKQNQRLG